MALGPDLASMNFVIFSLIKSQLRGFKDLDTCILKYETITVISKIDSSKKTQK